MNIKSKAIYFLLIIGVIAALAVPAFASEGIPVGSDGIIYVTDEGMEVWGPSGYDDHWDLRVYMTNDTEESLEDYPETPILVTTTEDSLYSVYKLSSNEYQIMVGPDDSGKVVVVVVDDSYSFKSVSEFNINEIQQ